MKTRHLILLFLGTMTFQNCRTSETPAASELQARRPAAGRGAAPISIEKAKEFDISNHKGQTYLSFMTSTIKPAIDKVIDDKYEIGDGQAMQDAYDNSDDKVQNKIKKMIGIDVLKQVADSLKGKKTTGDELPLLLMKDSRVPRGAAYNLASFMGLASGGGVVIKYADKNYSYNIHYDKTEQKSGRSYGTGPNRGANDASDKQYLDDLQALVTSSTFDTEKFYNPMLGVLLNLDNTGYEDNSAEGQGVLTDFLAVYTAEQARNLMDGRITLHWDAALLEVTLLASFNGAQNQNAGKDELYLYFRDPAKKTAAFTNKVLDQTACAEPTKERGAKLRDYWQFSKNITDPKNCKRSGINVTKSEFRKLGEKITLFMAKSSSYKNLAKLVPIKKNAYLALSEFLINSSSKSKYSQTEVDSIKKAWVAFMLDVNKNAAKITAELQKQSSGAGDTSSSTPENFDGHDDFISMENFELGLD